MILPSQIREMRIDDYDGAMGLLGTTSGVRLRAADSREAIARYLERNPGLSLVAVVEGQIAGCVLCGHDGRRGYLYHLAVGREFRRRGIGSALIETCLKKLERLGIFKAQIDVLVENQDAIGYWTRRGWQRRDDVLRFSIVRGDDANA